MDTSYEDEEVTPLVPRPGIPTAVPDRRQPYQKKLAVYIILTSILLERIAFYALVSNLALILELSKQRGTSSIGSIVSLIFFGTSNISSVIFAIMSDAKLGRAKTIIIGFLLYLIGYISAILLIINGKSACISNIFGENDIQPTELENLSWCRAWIFSTLVIIAIGAGAVQSNMTVFGAEQIQESKITSRYFDKYLVAVNLGGILTTVAIRTFYYHKQSSDILNDFLTPCIITTLTIFVSGLLFLLGWRYYIHVKPYETVVANCIPVIINAIQSWHKYKQKKKLIDNQNINPAETDLMNASNSLLDDDKSIRIDEYPATFLDFAKVPYGKFHDRIVDDVKSLRGALIVFILLIPYWLVYNQLNSTFPVQAHYMSGANPFTVAFMWLGDPIIVIVGIFILNIFTYKRRDAHKKQLTIETKFIIGMSIAFLSMCMAGTVEVFRQEQCDHHYNTSISNSTVTIYAQLPQNIFIGLSEVFAMLASFEYAYFAAPLSAQTLFMSLRFCSLGVSSFIGAGYFAVFSFILRSHGDLSNDQSFFQCPIRTDESFVYYTYFFVLAGMQLIAILIFMLCQRKYEIIKLNPQQLQTNQFFQYPSTNRQ